MKGFKSAFVLVVSFSTLVSGCVSVDSGHQGILFTAFSGTQPEVYPEGWHALAPWNKMIVYEMRTRDMKEDLHVLAKNGLSITLETSIRFRPIPGELFKLQTEIGPRYFETILAPVVRSEARKVGGRYDPEEIYSTKRETVEKEFFDEVQKAIAGKHIMLEAILVRNVDLPDNIKKAINDKLEEEQKALKMSFTLQKEKQEAERKRIEAAGVRDFQDIVSQGISDKLLRWKGIEATESLVKSANAKVVIIGAGKDGLPVILGGN
ncbi:MAG: prohibitin family protein [Deltaproteobacteria bacterium]|nr:prohibitin family protein [Deltaproteobacteria bacterium]